MPLEKKKKKKDIDIFIVNIYFLGSETFRKKLEGCPSEQTIIKQI